MICKVSRERVTKFGRAYYVFYWKNSNNERFYPEDDELDYVGDFLDGYAIVRKGDKWGFISIDGKIIGEIKYDTVREFEGEFARVELDGQWGFINRQGIEICEIKYYFVWNFNEGLALVAAGQDDYGMIDEQGNEICQPIYRSVQRYGKGLRLKTHSKETIYVDKSGNIVDEKNL